VTQERRNRGFKKKRTQLEGSSKKEGGKTQKISLGAGRGWSLCAGLRGRETGGKERRNPKPGAPEKSISWDAERKGKRTGKKKKAVP